jgi:hypothetical protein
VKNLLFRLSLSERMRPIIKPTSSRWRIKVFLPRSLTTTVCGPVTAAVTDLSSPILLIAGIIDSSDPQAQFWCGSEDGGRDTVCVRHRI